jgi:Uma2 family endonuclease
MTVVTEPPRGRLRMTEEEFDAWCTPDVRAEFVDGEVIVMSPVLAVHNHIFQFLSKLLGMYLEFRPGGTVYGSEFLVRLRPGLRRVPDLFFLADGEEGREQPGYLEGAPDIAFEIVSEDSIDRDWRQKFLEYEASGLKEYWIIDPAHQAVRLYRLVEGRYVAVPVENDRLGSGVLPGFWIKPEWLWQRPHPSIMSCLREMDILP